jgi:phosphoribosyl-ATP pyrophosphohydrolase/phosphoribosyl-AMP cyclohydrolase
MNIDEMRFDKDGLVPAIVQDARTRAILMLAYMNKESLRRTIETGETWFWSRSRAELWHKGATSGNTQRLVSVTADCDGDALKVLVLPNGPACHKGTSSCFQNVLHATGDLADSANGAIIGEVLNELYEIIKSRKREPVEGAYTSYLFEQGLDKILKKLGEESSETIIAAKNEDVQALTREVCDLLYHLMVLLVEREVTLADVREELMRRRSSREKEPRLIAE